MTQARAMVWIALLVAACGSDPGSATGKFVVRYHPPPGALFRYEVLEDMSMGLGTGLLSGGDREIKVKMYFTQEISDPGGGRFRVTTKVDSVSADAPGLSRSAMAAEFGRLRGRGATMVLDDRMQVVSEPAPTRGGGGPTPTFQSSSRRASEVSLSFFPKGSSGKGTAGASRRRCRSESSRRPTP